LLRALAQVPEVDLQLAGDGPLQPDLRALAGQLQIADRVEFLGNVNHAVLPAVYQPADVLAQASRHEGQGLAVLEAAACGLPVVGTPVGVLPELGQAARDEAELVQRLTELRDDDAQRRRLGQRAYQSVQTKFALNVTSGRWRELYLSL
jgi:glycosyltransferase involved in cell wall biosynthesis